MTTYIVVLYKSASSSCVGTGEEDSTLIDLGLVILVPPLVLVVPAFALVQSVETVEPGLVSMEKVAGSVVASELFNC